MRSKTPTVRQVAWISLFPHLLLLAIIIGTYFLLEVKDALIYGASTYILISFSLRKLIPKDHNNGMQLVQQRQYAVAIQHFENSYHFFTRNLWIDRFRYWTLLSSSAMSYREMALNNIAFCYSQLGDGLQAEEGYRRALGEFPESAIAKAALQLIDSVKANEDASYQKQHR